MRMILQGNTARDRETVRERDQEREKQKVCVEERRVPSREKDHGQPLGQQSTALI